jgi:hypothetical protein
MSEGSAAAVARFVKGISSKKSKFELNLVMSSEADCALVTLKSKELEFK